MKRIIILGSFVAMMFGIEVENINKKMPYFEAFQTCKKLGSRLPTFEESKSISSDELNGYEKYWTSDDRDEYSKYVFGKGKYTNDKISVPNTERIYVICVK